MGWAGPVRVTAGELQSRGGQISSSTYGHGNSEQVTVRADRLTVDGWDRSSPFYSGIFSDAVTGSGNRAGRVEVTAGELTLLNGGYISSDTYAGGSAGTVTVKADRLLISGASNDGQLFSGISSEAQEN